jgi:membrane protein required for colicin V production
MVEFGWVDISIFALVGLSILIGVFRGFIKEALSLCTWSLAIWMGVLFHDVVSAWLLPHIKSDTIRSIAAFGTVFLITLIAGMLATFCISLLVKKSGLGGTDRLLGVVFGMARGVLVVGLTLTVISYTTLRSQPWWTGSVLIPKFQPLMVWLSDIVPDQINVAKDAINLKRVDKPPASSIASLGLDSKLFPE